MQKLYQKYTHHVLPWVGQKVTGHGAHYRYLQESIELHPKQQALLEMMQKAGFDYCEFNNMSGGIVALHQGMKL